MDFLQVLILQICFGNSNLEIEELLMFLINVDLLNVQDKERIEFLKRASVKESLYLTLRILMSMKLF